MWAPPFAQPLNLARTSSRPSLIPAALAPATQPRVETYSGVMLPHFSSLDFFHVRASCSDGAHFQHTYPFAGMLSRPA